MSHMKSLVFCFLLDAAAQPLFCHGSPAQTAPDGPYIVELLQGAVGSVTIGSKNLAFGTTANPDEERLIKELWPDQETYRKEEQRRFEILLAHWDLPLTDITPAAARR